MELPRLEPLYKKYRDQGLQVIAVESHRDRDRAKAFIAKNNLTYPCLENGEGDQEFVSTTLQISGYPSSFLINGDGQVMYFHYGYDEGDDLKIEKEIRKLLSL